MKFYLAALTLLLICSNAHAGLNKWVDANGIVHYSDTVPPEVSSTQSVRNVAGKDQANAPAGFTPKTIAEREAELRKSKQEKDEASKKKAQQDAAADAKKRNCEAARQSERTLAEGARLSTYDANGERTIMDDSTRAQQLEEARKAISANCN